MCIRDRVYKATWPDEEAYICTVQELAAVAKKHNITKTALVLVGDCLLYTSAGTGAGDKARDPYKCGF